MLEESLSPLKFSFNFLFTNNKNKNTEFNPITLRFKSKEVYCKRHKDSRESCVTKPFRYFLNLLPFSNNLLRTTATLRTKKSNKTKDLDTTSSSTDINNNLQDTSVAGGDQHSVSRFKNRIKKVQANASLDDQSIMDELNSTCVMCLAEDSSIGNDLLLSCEKIYSSQPAMMFKYEFFI